jgi:hypothetical protein
MKKRPEAPEVLGGPFDKLRVPSLSRETPRTAGETPALPGTLPDPLTRLKANE